MIDTHNVRIDFGKYEGELWTRLPIGYLVWLVDNHAKDYRTAQAELDRRGYVEDHSVNVSAHAIDRASLRYLEKWREASGDREGLYSWLRRMATEALEDGCAVDERYEYDGITFIFAFGEVHPTLKTVL